jgi:hypothetical protein
MTRLKYLLVVVALAACFFTEISVVDGLLVFALFIGAAGYLAAILFLARFRFALAIFVAAGWYTSAFLTYLLPAFSDLLLWIGIACWLPMFFLSLSALFRRQWSAVAIFSAAWLVAALPFLGVADQFNWLLVQGLRIRASSIEEYLSQCRLTEFVESGVKQTVGLCENSDGPVTHFVFYDTTGELASPLSQRTPEWKGAMWHYPPQWVLRDSEDRAVRLFGNFYGVSIPNKDFFRESPPIEKAASAQSDSASCIANASSYVVDLDALLSKEKNWITPYDDLNQRYFPFRDCEVDALLDVVRRSSFIRSISYHSGQYFVDFTSDEVRVGFTYRVSEKKSESQSVVWVHK